MRPLKFPIGSSAFEKIRINHAEFQTLAIVFCGKPLKLAVRR